MGVCATLFSVKTACSPYDTFVLEAVVGLFPYIFIAVAGSVATVSRWKRDKYISDPDPNCIFHGFEEQVTDGIPWICCDITNPPFK